MNNNTLFFSSLLTTTFRIWAAIKYVLHGANEASTVDPNATATCCHVLSRILQPSTTIATDWIPTFVESEDKENTELVIGGTTKMVKPSLKQNLYP